MFNEIKISAFLLILSASLFSCAPKSKVAEANGDVSVQIASNSSSSEYSVQVVTLKGITDLKEVAGAFAKFFYSPGASGGKLTGSAPKAHFMRTTSFFVPIDYISLQMATVYYHLQNLAEIDTLSGAGGVNQWPRSVGIDTQVINNPSLKENNAFYNGETDSMMFVPFTMSGLPIVINGGVIAHEHFHSLFYKLVIKPAFEKNKQKWLGVASIHNANGDSEFFKMLRSLDVNQKAEFYNRTLIGGINEGLADYWGWNYTNDPDFINWSVPEAKSSRTLTMGDSQVGSYQTKEAILIQVEQSQQGDEPGAGLGSYAYEVGTSHARFLRQLVLLQAEENKIEVTDAKALVGNMVINYLKAFEKQLETIKGADLIPTNEFFNFFAQEMTKTDSKFKLTDKSCKYLVSYLNQESPANKLKTCGNNALGQLTIQEAK